MRAKQLLPILLAKYPAVAEAAHSISSPPLKTRGTLGGNLCVDAAAHAARLDSRPLDNTDLDFSWRRSMVEVWVRRTLEEAARRASLF